MARYWEDYSVGDRFITPARTITEGMVNICAGVGGYTVSFFWDEESGKKSSIFGSRVAPGPFTLFVIGGLEEQSGMLEDDIQLGLVGIDKVFIRAPVRYGDTIRSELEVTELRKTRNPERGLIMHRSICRNQNGDVVLEAEWTHLVRRRV